jgi:hypothetical protein
MSYPDNKEGILGEHTVEINDSGIKDITQVSESMYKWNGVKSIEQSKDYIFIFVDSIQAYFIPKRSFSSEKDNVEFYHQAMIYFNKGSS